MKVATATRVAVDGVVLARATAPDEFAFLLNAGDVKRHTLQRLDSFVAAVAGKRITYKELIAEVSQ